MLTWEGALRNSHEFSSPNLGDQNPRSFNLSSSWMLYTCSEKPSFFCLSARDTLGQGVAMSNFIEGSYDSCLSGVQTSAQSEEMGRGTDVYYSGITDG